MKKFLTLALMLVLTLTVLPSLTHAATVAQVLFSGTSTGTDEQTAAVTLTHQPRVAWLIIDKTA